MTAVIQSNDPVSIDPSQPLPPAEDFASMRDEALGWLPVWCARNWTDFNAHDPGIMMLEQLLYGLTELSYRASLPVDDLLKRDAAGNIPWNRDSLYAPTEILPMAPLTADDYARLLYDRIPQVRYATIAPLSVAEQRLAPGAAGRLVASIAIDPRATEPEVVIEAAERLLRANANLGERFERIEQLKPAYFGMTIEVQLEPGISGKTAAENLHAAVATALEPTAHFRTLAQAMVLEPIDDALIGPLLGSGIITDADMPRLLTWAEAKAAAAQAVLKVPGIAAVKAIEILPPRAANAVSAANAASPPPPSQSPAAPGTAGAPGRSVQSGQESLQSKSPVPSGSDGPDSMAKWFAPYPHVTVNPPDPPPTRSLTRTIEFKATEATNEFFATAPRPKALVAIQHRNAAVQFTRLLPDPGWLLPNVPDEAVTEIGDYYSIQNEFPPCFALQHGALPADASARRRAQVQQLRGYLLVFEQLLANYLEQLEHTVDFFSNEPQQRTTFTQPLATVPDVLPVLVGYPFDDSDANPAEQAAHAESYWNEPANPYVTGLRESAETAGEFLSRRGRVLDHLLARFNESYPATDEEPTFETIRNKEDLLRGYCRLSAARAQAADFVGPSDAEQRRPRSGLEEKLQLLLRRDTQPAPAKLADESVKVRPKQPADFYFVLETIRFLPPNDSEPVAGEVWLVPEAAFNPALFHTFINWTYEPLNTALIGYVRDLVAQNAPAHLFAYFIWLETYDEPAGAAQEFLDLFRAWAAAGYPTLQLGITASAMAGVVPVLSQTPAARLFRWLWDNQIPPADLVSAKPPAPPPATPTSVPSAVPEVVSAPGGNTVGAEEPVASPAPPT